VLSGDKSRHQLRQIASIGIAFLLILQLLVLCAAQTLAASEHYVAVVGNTAISVRSGPGTSYAKVGTANKGSTFDYLGEQKDGSGVLWYKIQYTSAVQGWIISSYSTKVARSSDPVQSFINSTAAKYGAAGLQVAVIENGAVTNTYSYGWATKGSVPMTDDHKIRTASISKVAVAVNAMKMVEQGTVTLDANIGDYWGSKPYRAVTLKSLLTHTSTLGSLSYSNTRAGTLTQLRTAASYSGGTIGASGSWVYNNYGMGVAGSTLEVAADQLLTSYAKTNIFQPLGMDASFLSGLLNDTSLLATLYYPDGNVARSVSAQLGMVGRTEPGSNTTAYAGGLICSAKDLAKMFAMLANDGTYNGVQVLTPESVSAMETRFFTKSESGGTFSQCLALRYMDNMFGQSGLYYHTGNAYGVLALASYNPASKNGVVVLSTGMTSSGTVPSCGRDSKGIYRICSEISEYIYSALDTGSAPTTSATTTTTATTTTAAPSVPVTSIALSQQGLEMKLGGTAQLTYTAEPANTDETLRWHSSGNAVTVDQNGIVTASGYGTATVTVSGSAAQASCTITVQPEISLNMLGASIRVSEPYGIRFGVQLGKNNFYSNGDIVEYGTLIIPAAALTEDTPLALDTPSVLRIKAEKILSEDNSKLIYTGVLIDIPDSLLPVDMTARGYLIYRDADGKECVVYTDCVTRSFNYVTQAAYDMYTAIENPSESDLYLIEKLEGLLGKQPASAEETQQ